jgi:coenzyme F420 hydrogenase subunit beta
VARGGLCSGCGGCALAAPGKIAMAVSPAGYLRPRQSAALSPAEEARIAALCPGLGQSVAVAPGQRDDVLWGPHVAMCQGHAADPELRHAASSGGALSALLVHLLHSGAVQGVVQTAADPARAVANVTVISRGAAGVAAAAGSRYAPSAPLAALGPLLDDGGRYAFVGKPCDVAALRALARLDPRIDARFPVMLSFFCAGVPSLNGGEAVLAAIGTNPAETAAFRYRGNGWPGRATARLHDGTERSMSYHDSWGGILSKQVQHRCRICADGSGVAADLVCADAWASDAAGYPVFEDRPGLSLIVARTLRGQALLREAEAAGALVTQPFDTTRLAAMQPGQSGRRRALLARLTGLRLCLRPVPAYRGLHLWAAARQNSPGGNLKNLLGTLRRVFRGRPG